MLSWRDAAWDLAAALVTFTLSRQLGAAPEGQVLAITAVVAAIFLFAQLVHRFLSIVPEQVDRRIARWQKKAHDPWKGRPKPELQCNKVQTPRLFPGTGRWELTIEIGVEFVNHSTRKMALDWYFVQFERPPEMDLHDPTVRQAVSASTSRSIHPLILEPGAASPVITIRWSFAIHAWNHTNFPVKDVWVIVTDQETGLLYRSNPYPLFKDR